MRCLEILDVLCDLGDVFEPRHVEQGVAPGERSVAGCALSQAGMLCGNGHFGLAEGIGDLPDQLPAQHSASGFALRNMPLSGARTHAVERATIGSGRRGAGVDGASMPSVRVTDNPCTLGGSRIR